LVDVDVFLFGAGVALGLSVDGVVPGNGGSFAWDTAELK
jgi:hypothetical protein